MQKKAYPRRVFSLQQKKKKDEDAEEEKMEKKKEGEGKEKKKVKKKKKEIEIRYGVCVKVGGARVVVNNKINVRIILFKLKNVEQTN